MSNKLTIDFIENEFLKYNLILLSGSYQNKNQLLDYRCSCGREEKISWANFRQRDFKHCDVCHSLTRQIVKKLPFAEILNRAEYNNWRVSISQEDYESQNILTIKLICDKGHIFQRRTCDFKRCCAKCKPSQLGKTMNDLSGKRVNYWTFLSFDKVKNGRYYWFCKCDCGYVKSIIRENVITGNTKSCGCFKKTLVKEKSFHWNPNLTEEERAANWNRDVIPENKFWKRSVLHRDNFICQLSGASKDLNAHHLYSWKDNPDLRFNIENGITLTKSIHKLFHKFYGKTYNTKSQFEEFSTRYFSGEFNAFLPSEFQYISLDI